MGSRRSWILNFCLVLGSWRSCILAKWFCHGILYFATLPLPYFATRLRDTLYDCIWYGYGTNCYQILPYATSIVTPIHAFGTNCYQILTFDASMLTPFHVFGTNCYQIKSYAISMLAPVPSFGTNCYQIQRIATSMLTPIYAFGTNLYQILPYATSMLTSMRLVPIATKYYHMPPSS